jgi:hypothetical protein
MTLLVRAGGEGIVFCFPSVYVFVGESTTKWLHGLMPHVSPIKLNYKLMDWPLFKEEAFSNVIQLILKL